MRMPTVPFWMRDPAIRQRVGLTRRDLYGDMRKVRAHVPVQERTPEEHHSANARDTQQNRGASEREVAKKFLPHPLLD